jgi:hypothetical protein
LAKTFPGYKGKWVKQQRTALIHGTAMVNCIGVFDFSGSAIVEENSSMN